ncbi:MAG: DUF3874 domain-containing protein [Bacteroides sp.]|nr:DUF3874 domain-containing protein [Bacteroides sp.]MCI1682756.1 DUF3874 domain-containing protein [Bacteroides sp.]
MLNRKMTKMIAALLRVWRNGGEEPDPAGRIVKETPEKPEKTKLPAVPSAERNVDPICLTEQVNSFLQRHYDFRYNLLTEETEFRPLNSRGEAFQPIGKRDLNTLCLEAHGEGIPCWDKDVSRYIYSTRIGEYHPFRLYMDELPVWDGVDRLKPLAHRVSDLPLWVRGFHVWMLGLASQWMGTEEIHANSLAPILVSSEQGRQKSTFCKALMPPSLQRYYKDDLKLTAQGHPERLLAEMGLINMDEFDRFGADKMPVLKNLMQMSSLNICKAYQRNFRNLPRIASFIGTSNRYDLLTDPTGSRRFLCVEVQQMIDCTGIAHEQIFAQLKAELAAGKRSWFNKSEEGALQAHNAYFHRSSTAEDLFHSYFRATAPGEKSLDLTAADIYQELKRQNSAALKGCNPGHFGQTLLAAGIVRRHTEFGNVYQVVRR